MSNTFRGSFTASAATAAAGTAVTILIPGKTNLITRVMSLVFTSGSTAHTIVLARAIGETTLTASAAASQAVINVTSASPAYDTSGVAEALAASDLVAIENSLGQVVLHTVSSVASLAVTLSANLAVSCNAGAKVWAFYEIGRAVHRTITPKVSVVTSYGGSDAGVVSSVIHPNEDKYNDGQGRGRPILIYNANATAASVFDHVAAGYFSV